MKRLALTIVALAASALPALAQSSESRITPFSVIFDCDPTAMQITAKRKVQVGGYQLAPDVSKSCKDLKDGVCAWAGKSLSVEQNGPLTVVKGTTD